MNRETQFEVLFTWINYAAKIQVKEKKKSAVLYAYFILKNLFSLCPGHALNFSAEASRSIMCTQEDQARMTLNKQNQ
jgi:hypothetical protein